MEGILLLNSALTVVQGKPSSHIKLWNDFTTYIIEKLNELKTDDIEPLTSVAETTLSFREDKITSKNIKEKILKNSPQENKDFFVVPKVVE